MKYVAYCTKGLEEIAEKELCLLLSPIQILGRGDKRIIFKTNSPLANLTKVRTVDDLGILLMEIADIASVGQIVSQLNSADLRVLKDSLRHFRNITDIFSLTASIMGNKNLKPQKVKDKISTYIANTYQWTYSERDHTNFDVRIFIDRTKCILSLRLTCESMHHRTYKIYSRAGSLRPTVAAAMVSLAAKGKPYKKIVDNFCGSGTILCEAKELGGDVYGGDKETESVNMTQTNLANVPYCSKTMIKLLDATKTNWPNAYFDCAVSNLPWDKQVKIESITNLYEQSLFEYKRILKTDGNFCFLVSKPELFLKYAKRIFPDKQIQTISIGLLGQSPTLVYTR